MQRAPLLKPLSTMQEVVCNLLGVGLSYGEVAGELRISEDMVRTHTKRAAARIPGDLPAQTRCIVWARGATLDVLQGLTLRYEITSRQQRNSKPAPPHSGEVVGTARLL